MPLDSSEYRRVKALHDAALQILNRFWEHKQIESKWVVFDDQAVKEFAELSRSVNEITHLNDHVQ